MKRLRIKIKPDRFDYIIESITIIGLIVLFVLCIIYYGRLPDSIPTHFDLQGNPNSYGSKGSIWFLPILGAILYVGLTILSNYPHTFNYPVNITSENAARMYKKGIMILRLLKLIIIGLFLYINFKTIEIGLGISENISTINLPVILAAFFGFAIFSIIWMKR